MASVTVGFSYDVFLSFSGEDTRYGFTGNLLKALKDRGIHTFMDDEELRKGEEITPSLIKAIQQSRMAIIVLSKNYASSSFCLQELSAILDHNIKEKRPLVWPVFYKVDPSDVRKLKGIYGKAMDLHEATSNDNMDRLQKWKNALHQVANLSGFHYKKGDGYEHEFIGNIVEQVSKEIKPQPLAVADYLVGLEPPKEYVTSLLNVGFDDKVHMVGIHGIGGIGKTTLARAVYDSIAHQFAGSCFLENVRENSDNHGLPYLQKILLFQIVGEKNIEFTGFKQGIPILKERLRQKKILLILDDIDKEEQLHAIAGGPEWFGLGSRVIITTRDKRLLTCHGVESTYEVQEMNKKDAFELLRRKAFKTDEVCPSYADVLNRALTYASGLPLALEVIGSHLFNKTVEECKSALGRYERTSDKKIQTILKESFDALEEEEQSVFLDIACCFRGYELAMLEKILHAHHGHCKKDHINVLVEKSLIKISESGNVTLHDLIEDMGKEIVRQESLEEPGKRSRLWFPEDIVQVFEENTGTSKIEIIYFASWIEVKWDGEAFKKMKNLRTLIIYDFLFFERVLQLRLSASRDLPPDFYPKKLDIWMFSNVFTRLVYGGLFKKKFENMIALSFHGCESSKQTADISSLIYLEEFSVTGCWDLITFNNLISLMGKLRILRITNCCELTSIPLLNLTSLEELNLSNCDSLKSFSLVVDGLMDKLKILSIKRCDKLRNIPPIKLASLEELVILDCGSLKSLPLVMDGSMGKLKILNVQGCSKLESIPPLKLASLEKLDLSDCDSLENFPHVVDGLMDKLKILRVKNCSKLKNIPPIKSASLEELDLSQCRSLKSFPHVVDGLMDKLKILSVKNCRNLKNFPPIKLASLEELYLSDCASLENFPHVVDGLMDKLKVLTVNCCMSLRSIPPLKLASLEELSLSYCGSFKRFSPMVDTLMDKLKILRVKNCNKLESIPPIKLASLEELVILYCGSLESLPLIMDGSMGKLKILNVQGCSKLKNIPPLKLASLEKLDVLDCDSLENFPHVVDGLLDKLKILRVKNCSKLKNFPPIKLASLEELYLLECRSLESFPLVVDGLLDKLKILNVKCCSKLRSIPSLKLALLEELDFSYCDSLESWQPLVDDLPEKLKILTISHCSKLKSIPPFKLTSLEELHIWYCDSLESLPPMMDVTMGKLKILSVKGSNKFRSIPPLNLASLEEVYLSCCDSLESLPPIMDGSLDKLKVLSVECCNKLTNIPPFKLPLLETLDLSYCGGLESFPPVVDGVMDKLKILRFNSCTKLKNVPPIRMASIEELDLSECHSLESFPPIEDGLLRKFKILIIEGCFKFRTSILPLNLASLKCHCGIAHSPPSGIAMMSEPTESTIKDVGWLFPKYDEGEEKGSPMQSLQIKILCLCNHNLSDESLAIGLKWFANVKELYLSENKFTMLPECIENCHFLWKLILDNCEELQEIKGIPPSLKTLSSLNCESLIPSCKSNLLNQELHEAGNTWFRLPRAMIPNWFDHQCEAGSSITFWFRNKFPPIALCVVSPLTWNIPQHPVRVIVNGIAFFYRNDKRDIRMERMLPKMYHLHLFHMQMGNFNDNLDKALLKNKWNHVEVDFGFPFQKGGIHILKEISSVNDIQFTNPEINSTSSETTI